MQDYQIFLATMVSENFKSFGMKWKKILRNNQYNWNSNDSEKDLNFVQLYQLPITKLISLKTMKKSGN